MRLLLLNPNTTEALTQRLAASARAVLPAEVSLLPLTAPDGFPYISSRAEAQIAGARVLDLMAERHGEFDGAVIAAFGDPGLAAARESFDLPVTGMTEASMASALQLGQRFAFVTFTPRLAPWYAGEVTRAGLEGRFAGVHAPEAAFASVATVAEEMAAILRDLCCRVAREADVLILAGAPLAGLAPEIAADVPAVLLDPVRAAVLQAHALWRLRPAGADRGSYARPPGKDSTGLRTATATWLRRDGV